MVNIDHVNKYFWIRLPLFPFVALNYLYKRLSINKFSRNYILGVLDMGEETRYGNFLSLYEKYLFLQYVSYFFYFPKRIIKQQTVFVINDNLTWDSVSLLRYMIKYEKHPFPKFLLNNIFISGSRVKKTPVFWDLIDTFYGEKDLDRAISSKRSFFIEKSFLERHPQVIEKIKKNYLSITPIFKFKESGTRVWYLAGEIIKTSSLINFRTEALLEHIQNSFLSLEKTRESIVLEYRKSRKVDLKKLFKI